MNIAIPIVMQCPSIVANCESKITNLNSRITNHKNPAGDGFSIPQTNNAVHFIKREQATIRTSRPLRLFRNVSCKLRIVNCELRIVNYKLKFTNYELQKTCGDGFPIQKQTIPSISSKQDRQQLNFHDVSELRTTNYASRITNYKIFTHK